MSSELLASGSEGRLDLSNAAEPDATAEIAFVYGAPAGIGGLGVQSANALAGLSLAASAVHAFGPGHVKRWPLSERRDNISWHEQPARPSFLPAQYTWRRWYHGRLQFEHDTRLGRWAVENVADLRPQRCYVFTQVGLEVLKWAKANGVPSVLESPNGHIRNFREVYDDESARWCGSRFQGHPTSRMVERVEQEYVLADRIRVSSEWARNSLVNSSVPASKIHVLQQPVDLDRFQPSLNRTNPEGPLRICFVGSLDLRKGFIYLLRAMRLVGPERVSLEIVGATGTRCCARLFEKESQGLTITSATGDPVPAYHRAELFVLPTLEDGSPFAVAEAMACGCPVVVTDSCGSAEWVKEGMSGWVIPSRSPEDIAEALETALRERDDLRQKGALARLDTEERAGPACFASFRDWLHDG